MKYPITVMFVLLLTAYCTAQTDEAKKGYPYEPSFSVLSPFHQLTAGFTPLKKTAAPFACPGFYYYDPSGQNVTLNEQLNTSEWAVRITPPSSAFAPCTVWTINLEFELNNAAPNEKDTIRLFVREATAPHATIYNTWFIARPGTNSGQHEIDPPIVPPFNIRPILVPKRDVFVGVSVRGGSTRNVDWKFKTPSQFNNPVRSVKFVTQTSFVPASVGGNQVDMILGANVCCYFPPWPVELALFSAVFDGSRVRLNWRTDSETNNFHFEVQRASQLGGPWTSRGFVPGRGTTTLPQYYDFADPFLPSDFPNGVPEVMWYRLKQMDFDGTIEELPPIRVTITPPESGSFKLHALYPNPLTQTTDYTTIRYQLSSESPVQLSVFDALGREVTSLVNRVQPAGYYDVIWSPALAEHVRSGQYYIRLQTENHVAVEKLTVLK